MTIDFVQPKGIDNFSDFGIRFISGINEYLENAIEANARNIMVVLKNNGSSIDAIIIEDGMGMDGKTLQYAISFGGEDGGVKSKAIGDIGKFHAGMTIASMTLSDYVEVFSNNGEGWVKNYLNKEEIKRTRKIYPSENCEIPSEITNLLNDIKRENGLEIELKTGTIIVLKNIDTEIIGPSNFDLEVEELFNNSCIRYYDYLADDKNSIYIMVNDVNDIRKCESIHPLLKDTKLLEKNGLEIFANFKYKNILTIKEVHPYSKVDDSMDIEFVLIRKKNKSDKMLKAHDLVKMNMDNQGSYFARNYLNLIRAEKIGYDKKHNSLNGVRTYSNLNGNWDSILGINVNKSLYNLNSKFYQLLNERLKKVYTHLRKVLTGKENFEPPIIKISGGRICEPEILINLTEKNNTLNISTNIDEQFDNKHLESDTNKNIDLPNEKHNLIIKSTNEKTDKYNLNNNIKNCSVKDEIQTNLKLDGKVPIIFASKQKPNIKFNMTNGSVNLTKDNESYYIYNKDISNLGVRKVDIEEWCKEEGISEDYFYKKIKNSIRKEAKAQIKFYEYYMEHIYSDSRKDFFLFPEVYVNVNVKSWDYKNKQCVDFMIILPNKEKIIIEIDGIGHYGDKYEGKWNASSKKYTIDRKFDREMLIQGYKVVRFSNTEITTEIDIVRKFFNDIFK